MNEALSEFKHEFWDRESIQFNNAGLAPISNSVAMRISTMISQNQFQGSLMDLEWLPIISETRKNLANFLGAQMEEVAFSQNCASALSQAALGYPLKPGDEVITLDQEYASNYYPWKTACERSGAKFTAIESGSDFFSGAALTAKIVSAIKPGVKIVALSWVEFQTGAVLDLRAIGEKAHSVGAFFVADGIQGIGQLPFSFKDLPVDFVVGGSHKWMCSLTGQGFFAVKKNFSDLLSPTLIGCGTFNRFGTFADPSAAMETTARKFEAGGFGFIPMFALNEAIKVHSRAGMEVIAEEVYRLSRLLREGLHTQGIDLVTPLEQRSGITSFRLPINKEIVFLQRCREEQIAVAKRGEYIRISLHAYCDDDEVLRVLQVLASIPKV